jgi:hypothetical protein
MKVPETAAADAAGAELVDAVGAAAGAGAAAAMVVAAEEEKAGAAMAAMAAAAEAAEAAAAIWQLPQAAAGRQAPRYTTASAP